MKDRSKEIKIFCILIIVYSVWDWRIMANIDHYHFLFQALPEKLIMARYIFSICFRIMLLVTSVGVFFLKDKFRRVMVMIGFFIIGTIYWKHPIDGFNNIITMLIQRGAVPANVMPFTKIMPWILLALSYMFDIGFALCIIIFFLLPEVKKQFKR